MIIEIEDYCGNTIGAVQVHENGIDGDMEILDTEGNISIADIDFDNIFDTNEKKLRIAMELKHLTINKPKSNGI